MSITKLKALSILDILYKNTDETHKMIGSDLCEELGKIGISAERKSVYRDIDMLIEYGEDIRKTKNGYYLGKRRFEIAELRLLISAVQSANFIPVGKSDALINKLAGFLSKYQAENILKQTNLGVVKCDNQEIFYNIEAINLAIASKSKISFTYFKRDVDKRSVVQRRGERYKVSPYAMIWMQDRYYLVCNMEERDDLTHFRLDRMKLVYAEKKPWRHFSEVSEYADVFDIPNYAAKCVNMFGGEPEKVILRCNTSMINEVIDRFGEEISVTRINADCFSVAVRAVAGRGLEAWIAQFGSRVKVMEPKHLRESVIRLHNDALKNYGK